MGKHEIPAESRKPGKGTKHEPKLFIPKALKTKQTTRKDWEERNKDLPLVISRKNV